MRVREDKITNPFFMYCSRRSNVVFNILNFERFYDDSRNGDDSSVQNLKIPQSSACLPCHLPRFWIIGPCQQWYGHHEVTVKYILLLDIHVQVDSRTSYDGKVENSRCTGVHCRCSRGSWGLIKYISRTIQGTTSQQMVKTHIVYGHFEMEIVFQLAME